MHFNPQVAKYGFTNWAAFDKILEEGYRYAKERLSAMPEEKLQEFRAG